jgi:hypothetical protein
MSVQHSGDMPVPVSTDALRRLWSRFLPRSPDRIRDSDSFFDIGGESLLAIRMLAEVDRVFGVQVPIVGFFNAPTIGHLRAVLAEGGVVTTKTRLEDGSRAR